MTEVMIKTRHNPSFLGKHNATRCKSWLVLYDRYLSRKSGLTLKELAAQSGCNYYSLAHRLKDWTKWGYLLRSNTRPYVYGIAVRGREWLLRWQSYMPLERYCKEIEATKK